MNKCRGEIVQVELYNGKYLPWEEEGEKREKGMGTEMRWALFERGWVIKNEKSPRINDLLIIMSIIFLKNAIKHHNNCYQTYWSSVLQSILYKFIDYVSLSYDPILFGLEPRNHDPTLNI